MKAFFNHLNPAVIRSLMLEMNKEELQECINFIRDEALNLPNGSKRNMYVSLYNWSNKIYIQKYKTEKPSLF